MPKRLFHALSCGGPVSVIWSFYVGIGAVVFGIFSVPSKGSAVVLIPMFLTSGVITALGTFMLFKKEIKECARFLTVVGLFLMTVASWTRAVSLWGVDQQGAGSNILATLVWVWITLGCILLLIAVWMRGLR